MYIPHKGSKNVFFVSAVLETLKLNIIIKVKIQPRSKETSHLEEDFLGTPRPRDRLPRAELTSQVNYSKW